MSPQATLEPQSYTTSSKDFITSKACKGQCKNTLDPVKYVKFPRNITSENGTSHTTTQYQENLHIPLIPLGQKKIRIIT